MKVEDFGLGPQEQQLPYDVADDIKIFMRNDPMFYRKQLFPAIQDMKKCHNAGTEYNPHQSLLPIVDSAIKQYCSKFKLPMRPNELLDKEEKETLLSSLFAEEMTNIKKGEY